jgi:hypothetical protein
VRLGRFDVGRWLVEVHENSPLAIFAMAQHNDETTKGSWRPNHRAVSIAQTPQFASRSAVKPVVTRRSYFTSDARNKAIAVPPLTVATLHGDTRRRVQIDDALGIVTFQAFTRSSMTAINSVSSLS